MTEIKDGSKILLNGQASEALRHRLQDCSTEDERLKAVNTIVTYCAYGLEFATPEELANISYKEVGGVLYLAPKDD